MSDDRYRRTFNHSKHVQAHIFRQKTYVKRACHHAYNHVVLHLTYNGKKTDPPPPKKKINK